MSRPWETISGSRPWESPVGLYPRVLTFKRPALPVTYGVVGYQGTTEATETLIASNIPANVEIASAGKNVSSSGLPADSPGPIKWIITLPASAMATLPMIMERDFVYDDLGRRFQVDAYQPGPLGARIDAVRQTA